MDTRQVVVDRLNALCKEKNMNMNSLSRTSAIPPSTVKGIFYGKSLNPGIVTIKMLCDGLGISLTEFFDTKEFRELEQEIK